MSLMNSIASYPKAEKKILYFWSPFLLGSFASLFDEMAEHNSLVCRNLLQKLE